MPANENTTTNTPHPCDAAYQAGAELASRLLERDRSRAELDTLATSPARRSEDKEAFLDGFWNVVNSTLGND